MSFFTWARFLDNNFTQPLHIANKKHDVVAIKIHDKREEILPNVGLVKMLDAENQKTIVLDSSSKKIREDFNKVYKTRENVLKQHFLMCGVDHIDINTDQSYVKPLINFFKQRGHRK